MEMPKWVKWLIGILVFTAATIAIAWLAGFVFFVLSKTNPFGKTELSTWWTCWQYYQDDPVIFKRLKVSGIIAAVIGYGAPLLVISDLMREVRTLHGEARFANTNEIEKAGLLGNVGIIVGKWKDRFLLFPGMQFVLLAAPTRSGKGVGIVVPNLLNFPESVVALDVKLENFLITSKFRARHGQEVYLFNPFAADGRTHRYNPLGYISNNPRLRVTEILAIGYALYPGASRDSFFDDTARNLFLALTLYLCETQGLPRTFGELLRQSSGKGQPIKTYLQNLIISRNYREVEEVDEDGVTTKTLVPVLHWDGKGLPPLSMECVDALNRFTCTSDNTLSSILTTFNAPLTIWVSPIVDAATSANDFDLRDVRKKRMSIYLGIPANKLAEAELLLNLFFSQLVNLNTDDLLYSKPELKYQCLMLMDEFAAPGRIGIIDKSNAYMAGYGMRMLTIIQSPSQIEAEPRKGYGREGAGTLITNHALQILYTPRKQSDANEYSEMLGYYTFKAKGLSRQRGGRNEGGHSESESDQKRALMLPQELKEMSLRKQIINLENTKPIQCEKIAYYADHVFIDRLKSVSPTLAALDNTPIRNWFRKKGITIKAIPSKKLLEATWGRGELASDIPLIDLDLHDAIVQERSRPMTTADVSKGIDLSKLAIDASSIPVPNSPDLQPEEIEAFVDDFFNALDAVNEYDENETGEQPRANTGNGLDDERLEAFLDNTFGPSESAKNHDEDGASERPSDEELEALDAQASNEIERVEPTADELAAMMEDYYPDDDGIMDETEMLAAMAAEETADYPSWIDEPILDLSVLEKPTPKERE
jgi:type IV secretion system protein VirD4